MQLKAVSKEPKNSNVSQSSKPAIAEIYRELSDIINHADFSGHKPMPETFYIIQPDRGPPQVVELIGENVVCYVDRIRVVSCLLRYIEAHLGGSRVFALTYKMAVECINYWASKTDPIPNPKPFANRSDNSLTFHKLPFDLIDDGKSTPYFDSILARMDNPDSAIDSIKQSHLVMEWFGSLFVAESDRSSYLWIYGDGGDGKGRLSRVLGRVLGGSFLGSTVPEHSGEKRFWTHGLLGKRLVAFGECNNFSFPLSGLFKSLTGGDSVTFEPKGLPTFSAVPECKFLFLSNVRPNVTGTKADMRRAVYVEMRMMNEEELGKLLPTPILDAHLWAEAPSFFGRCIAMYLQKYPDHGPILCHDQALLELIEENEEWMAELLNKYLIIDKRGSVPSSRMQEIKTLERLSHLEYRNWLSYLKRCCGIKAQRSMDARSWKGVRSRSGTEVTAFIDEKNR